jgi:hypothetical protein
MEIRRTWQQWWGFGDWQWPSGSGSNGWYKGRLGKEGIPKREGSLMTGRAPTWHGGEKALPFGNTQRLDCLLQYKFLCRRNFNPNKMLTIELNNHLRGVLMNHLFKCSQREPVSTIPKTIACTFPLISRSYDPIRNSSHILTISSHITKVGSHTPRNEVEFTRDTWLTERAMNAIVHIIDSSKPTNNMGY